MNPVLPPNVSIDGTAIRRIREDKKLTQLYVAKVVGVTTDTISRWENNRYPTIKRENVIRLGEALEVPVTLILRAEEDGTEEPGFRPEDSGASNTLRRIMFWGGLTLSGLLVFLVTRWNSFTPVAAPVTANRFLLPFAAPGSLVPVRLSLDVGEETKGYIVREHFPPGWKLIEASPPASSLDNEIGTVRWIVKPGEKRNQIAYLIQADAHAVLGGVAKFFGEVVANSDGHDSLATIGGDGSVTLAPYLWADLNGDSIISDGEMLEASDTVEDMGSVHLDWRQLESIWDAGSYGWDKQKKVFYPRKDSQVPERR